MKASGYCLATKRMEEFEVTKKIRSDIRGHLTYMLAGEGPNGVRLFALVNQSQWDRYDVPVEERRVEGSIKRSNEKRKAARRRLAMKPYEHPGRIKKNSQRVQNSEIEQWIMDHNGIDFDSLDGLDDGIIRDEDRPR